MQRDALRATVGGVVRDIPLGTFSNGQLVTYNSTTNTLEGVTGAAPTGPASGQLGGTYPNPDVRGLRAGDGTLLIIGGWTTGQALMRQGSAAVGSTANPDDHDARHNPGGADTMFPGTWTSGDEPSWNGSAWVPKFRRTLVCTAQRTTSSASLVDITDLTIALPRAGTYYFRFDLATTIASAAATTVGYGVDFSGTVTTMNVNVWISTSGTATAQGCVGDNVAFTGSKSLTTVWPVTMEGLLICSTTGTLSARHNKAAGGAADTRVNAGSGGFILEL